MIILRKIIASIVIITIPFPLIFQKTWIVNYNSLGERTYHQPNIELFVIPITFICLLIITFIWDKKIFK